MAATAVTPAPAQWTGCTRTLAEPVAVGATTMKRMEG